MKSAPAFKEDQEAARQGSKGWAYSPKELENHPKPQITLGGKRKDRKRTFSAKKKAA